MIRDSIHLRSGIAWALCVSGLLGAAARADTSLTIEAGVGTSDNMTRVEENEIDETIATLGVDLLVQVERPRFTADVALNADYLDYLDDTYDSEVMGTGNAQLAWAIVPERFNWRLDDYYGQQNSDPFSPSTPETRESVNFLSTGPDLLLRLGSAGVRLFSQYSLATYETSPIDNERVVAGFSVGRPGSNGQGLSFNAAREDVSFDDQPDNDFERSSGYLAYGISGARTQLRIEGGYTWLEPEVGEETGAPRALVEVERELTRHSSLTLLAGTQLTDSATALSASIDGPAVGGGGSGAIAATADSYENRNVALSWRFARRRTSLSLGVDWAQQRYETATAIDRTLTSYNFAVDRRIGTRLGVSLSAQLGEEEFDTAGFDAKTREFGASLDWDFGRTVGLRLSLEQYDRDTTTGLGEYTENRAFLRIYYHAIRGTPEGAAP